MKIARMLAVFLLATGMIQGAFADLPPGWDELALMDWGNISYDNGVWELEAPRSAYHCAYTHVDGDCVIRVRIRSADDDTRVLIGEGPDNSLDEQVVVHVSPAGGTTVRFEYRTPIEVEDPQPGNPVTDVGLPCWVWIERRGDEFAGYVSSDSSRGARRAAIGSVTVPMSARLVAGMAVAAHSESAASAEFDNVAVSSLGSSRSWVVAEPHMYAAVSGNVGIGTMNPTETLDVNGTARIRRLNAGGGAAVVVDSDGRLWKQNSSRRYKQNIRPIETDPYKVLELNPVRFQWNTTGERDIGLIAEDVAQALDDLTLYDQNGKPDGVKYDKLALYLLTLVKLQQQKIAQLEEAQRENKLLVGRIEALEETVRQSNPVVQQIRRAPE